MDMLPSILQGFATSFAPVNLLYCFIGVFIGTLIGVLPGIGPVGAISLLLPATFRVEPVSAIIMLAGIYYGAMYGGSTTSILVNIPGEAASVITCLDGYQMARKGRAGAALGISAFGSFIAGTIGVIALMLLAYPLAKIALTFGPPEYFSLMCLGLAILTYLAHGSMFKALSMAMGGLLLSYIGMDVIAGVPRFTMDLVHLMDGVGLVPIAMGLFGISEVLINVEETARREIFDTRIKGLFPNRGEWRRSRWPILRGTLIGFFLGHPARRRRRSIVVYILRSGKEALETPGEVRYRHDRGRCRSRISQQRSSGWGLCSSFYPGNPCQCDYGRSAGRPDDPRA